MTFEIDTDHLAKHGEHEVDNTHAWGREHIFCIGQDGYCSKLLELLQPYVLSSRHFHESITETLIVLSGCVSLQVGDGVARLYYPGQLVTIYPHQKHQFMAVQNPALILEASNRTDPDDDIKEVGTGGPVNDG